MLLRLPVAGEDWTEAERAELDRIAAETGWTLEYGRADEGDPWCIAHDGSMIMAHIARIGRSYVVHWPGWRDTAEAASISKAVDLVLTSG